MNKVYEKIVFAAFLLFSSELYARSVKGVARRVSRDVKDISVEILLVGVIVVGILFALGSRAAQDKAIGWGKGALFIFGGSTLIAFVKGWF